MKKIYLLYYVFIIAVAFIVACSKNEEQIYIPVPVVDKLPILVDDVVNSTLENSVEIPVLINDNVGDLVLANSVSIKNGIDTDNNGTLDKLVIENQGTWAVNPASGNITFTSNANFLGNPIKISYTAKDAQNNVSNVANVIINALPITIVDVFQEPFAKLSDYKFFVGAMKDQNPAFNVVPYEPASSLFTDYAKKKRFVWMPPNSKATYSSDNAVLELPVGSALVKTFYYENVQPNNETRIMETRVMIRKSSGWIFAEYIWNNEQTEATMNLNGATSAVSWKDENNEVKNVNYRFPNQVQCIICHKNTIDNQVSHTPIGIKPQNLNTDYKFGTETKNQLIKWIEAGKLDGSNFNLPSPEHSAVNYKDTSKSLELRARSYVDINCAHCHQLNKHCDYRPMRFAFSETGADGGLGKTNMGVCVNTFDMQNFDPNLDKIVTPSNIDRSMLYYRINTTNESYRMPLHGRTIIHKEGVELIKQWINSIRYCP